MRIESSRLRITLDHDISWQRDVYGNSVAIATFDSMHDTLELVSTVVVDQYEEAVGSMAITEKARQFPFRYDPMEQVDLVPYQTAVFAEDEAVLGQWIAEIWQPGAIIGTLDFLDSLNGCIARDIGYLACDEAGVQVRRL